MKIPSDPFLKFLLLFLWIFYENDNSNGSSQNALYARVVVRDVEEGFDSSLAYISRFHKSIFVRDCWRKFDIAARR